MTTPRLTVLSLRYAAAMWKLPAVRAWKKLAEASPRIPVYDDYVRSLGGDPG